MGDRMKNGSIAAWTAALAACAMAVAAQAAPKAGDVPPDLLGKTPKGEEIRISDHRGKVMVVSFWASWCGYCRKLFPTLDGLQRQVDPSQMRVVVVNFKEDVPTYRAVLRQVRESAVTWTHDRSGDVSDAYGVQAVPRMFLVDKAGRVAHVRAGYSEESLPSLVEDLNALLAEPGPAEAREGTEAPEAPTPVEPTPDAGDGEVAAVP